MTDHAPANPVRNAMRKLGALGSREPRPRDLLWRRATLGPLVVLAMALVLFFSLQDTHPAETLWLLVGSAVGLGVLGGLVVPGLSRAPSSTFKSKAPLVPIIGIGLLVLATAPSKDFVGGLCAWVGCVGVGGMATSSAKILMSRTR